MIRLSLYFYLSISLSLQPSQMSLKYIHIQVLVFHIGAKARGTLGSSPVVISCYITLSASFYHLISPLTSPPPYSPLHQSLYRTLSPPPFPALISSFPLYLGIEPPSPTTTVSPKRLYVVPMPEISTVSDESQYTGKCCSGGRGCIYTPRLLPPPSFLHTEAGITPAPSFVVLASFSPDDVTHFGGIH